jgi:translation initiation factor IF-3
VIDADGNMLGVFPVHEAVALAQRKELDLVEVNPKAAPPVCKIMNFGRFKYEEKKKARDQKKKQAVVEIKEIKLRPKTDDHDLEWKIRDIRRFLEEGNKVKLAVRFRGREMAHPERANEIVNAVLKAVEAMAVIEMSSRMEGRAMTVLIAPKPGLRPAQRVEPPPKEKAGKADKSEAPPAA